MHHFPYGGSELELNTSCQIPLHIPAYFWGSQQWDNLWTCVLKGPAMKNLFSKADNPHNSEHMQPLQLNVFL